MSPFQVAYYVINGPSELDFFSSNQINIKFYQAHFNYISNTPQLLNDKIHNI